MDFVIKNVQKSVTQLARDVGYTIIDTTDKGEYNLVRRLLRETYPRFHIYAKQDKYDFVVSLHLDQKKPSYEGGSHAHSGEYFGPLVEDEADRIRELAVRPAEQIPDWN